MKLIYTKLRTVLLVVSIFASSIAFAQTNYGQLRGTVKDALTGSILDYATVRLEQNGIFKNGSFSDLDGNFTFTTLDPGEYEVIVTYLGYDTAVVPVTITADSYIFREIKMTKGKKGGAGQVLTTIDIGSSRKLIEADDQKKTMTSKDLVNLSTRSLANIAGLQAGVNVTPGGGVSFRGSRTDGTAYYQDGVRMIGNISQIQGSQEQVTIYQNGIPAQFGDFTGGAIAVTTKGASRFHQGSVEFYTSTPSELIKLTGDRFDNDNRFQGKNRFDNNQIEAFAQGPLYIKNKGNKEKERVVMGYMVAGNASYMRDPSPSYIGVYKVKDDILDEMEETPLVSNRAGGLVHAGNYLTMDDLENVRVRPNSHQLSTNLQGKIDYLPTKKMDLSFFASIGYFGGPDVNSSIMNYKLNAISNNFTVRSYLRFTHRLPATMDTTSRKKSKTTFENTYYTLRVDYQNTINSAYDPVHGDRIFDYGYIGRFDRYQRENFAYKSDPSMSSPTMFVDQNGDTMYISNYYEQSGFADTAYKFTRANEFIPGKRGENMNPLRANFTSNLYDFYNERNINPVNELQILTGQGLINGYNPPNVYSIWATPGYITANWSKGQAERYTAFAMFETQMKRRGSGNSNTPPHDLQFGLTYEKTVNRGYGIAASSLWTLMPQLMNTHIQELDKENPILTYDKNGVFTDTVRYERFVNESQQTNFDKNFREKVINEGKKDVNGNLYGEKSFIEINSFTPDDYELSLFNADELLNNGSSLVSYYGYDHLGNIVRGKPTVDDFVNDPNKRLIGAFQPVYAAVWAQDKFAYKDIIFRLGLRVERYDANQLVLRDPYSLYPIRTAGEVSEINGVGINHPSNMGDDYQVYVNDVKNPTRVLGYRNEDQWYDANGNEISSPELIANQTNSGKIAPYLVDPANQELSKNSFRDYKPEINVLPRVLFSFPIRQDANFYASFDVLAQKPISTYSFGRIDNYYFMDSRNTGVLANPDLRSRIKTEYQIGFKQMIGEESAIEINAYYAEIKNDIQQFQFEQAYPVTYSSYQNIDFSTVKGFSAEYQLAGKHLSFMANYNLQYADGTGSNPNAAAALIASGQPNLRTLFPLGSLDIRHQFRLNFNYNFGRNTDMRPNGYQGPAWGEKVFRDVNANVVVRANSGLPYTQNLEPTQIGSADRSNIKGTPYGSRLPWQFSVDLNVQKSFLIKRGKNREGQELKPLSATGFFWVTNVFNFERIAGVYPYTGSPVDDGFINSPRGQQAAAERMSAQSYMDLYRVLTTNPGNFLAPRFARLGIRFNF